MSEPITGQILYLQGGLSDAHRKQLETLSALYRVAVLQCGLPAGFALISYRYENIAILSVGTQAFLDSSQSRELVEKLTAMSIEDDGDTCSWYIDFGVDQDAGAHVMYLGLDENEGVLHQSMPLALCAKPAVVSDDRYICCGGAGGQHGEHCLRQPCPIHDMPLSECLCNECGPNKPPGPDWTYVPGRGWFPPRTTAPAPAEENL